MENGKRPSSEVQSYTSLERIDFVIQDTIDHGLVTKEWPEGAKEDLQKHLKRIFVTVDTVCKGRWNSIRRSDIVEALERQNKKKDPFSDIKGHLSTTYGIHAGNLVGNVFANSLDILQAGVETYKDIVRYRRISKNHSTPHGSIGRTEKHRR